MSQAPLRAQALRDETRQEIVPRAAYHNMVYFSKDIIRQLDQLP